MERYCKYCDEIKDIDKFPKNKSCIAGHTWRCKECQNKQNRGYFTEGNAIIQSGIYKIQSKKIPDHIYIGSSKDIYLRWGFHKALKDINKNYKLYNHIKEYGIDDLYFSVLKICELDHLVYWEQYYISELNPHFNIQKFASEPNSKSNEARIYAFQDKEMCTNYFAKELQILNFLNESPEEIIPFNIL